MHGKRTPKVVGILNPVFRRVIHDRKETKTAVKIRSYSETDQAAIVALWKTCGLVAPQNDPEKDILRKLQVNPEWFLVAEIDGALVGSCMAGYEGHRGWINYLAVHPTCQRQGLATELMRRAEQLLHEAGCPKINLQIRSSNAAVIAFYEQLGYLEDEVVSLGKRLESDSP